MNYIFFHPSGQVVGGVFTYGLNLHRKDPSCLTLVLQKEASNFSCYEANDPKLKELAQVDSYQADTIAKGVLELAGRCQGELVLIPNYFHVCYEAAIVAARTLTAQGRKVRILGYCHTDEDFYYDLMRIYGGYCSRVVVVSPVIKELLDRQMPERTSQIDLLPYPVEPAQVRTAAAGPLRLLYAGRLEHRQKKIERLAELARLLNQMKMPAVLEIVGTGAAEAELRNEFETTVGHNGCVAWRFAGAVPPAAMAQLMAASDVLLLVSEFEGWPLILQEALAAGVCPVVMEVKSGIGDLITHKVNGVITPQGDVGAMAKALEGLSQNRAELERLCAAARVRAKSERGLDSFIPRLHEVLDQALAAPCPDFNRTVLNVALEISSAADELVQTLKADGVKRVSVYGAGVFGRYLLRKMREEGITPLCVIDSNEKMWGADVEGFACVGPQTLLTLADAPVVVASKAFGAPIAQKITALFEAAHTPTPKIYIP